MMQAVPAATMLAFAQRELRAGDAGLRSQNEARLQRAALNNTVVLSFASASSSLFAHNLRLSLQRLGLPNVCIVALDDACAGALTQLQPGACVLRDATSVPGAANGSAAPSESAPLRSDSFDTIQLAKYRWIRQALSLSLNVTFLDADMAVRRNFFPLLAEETERSRRPRAAKGQEAGDGDDGGSSSRYAFVAMPWNVGFFHFFGASAPSTIPLLNAFLYRMLYVVPKGTWDQDEWLSFHKSYCAEHAIHYRTVSELYTPGDGFIIASQAPGPLPPLEESLGYIYHPTVGFGWTQASTRAMKMYMLKEFHSWFAEEAVYEHNPRQFLFVQNVALQARSYFPQSYEKVELASAIGLAVALNRTLVLPYSRCAPGNSGMGVAELQCMPFGIKLDEHHGWHSQPGAHISALQGTQNLAWRSGTGAALPYQKLMELQQGRFLPHFQMMEAGVLHSPRAMSWKSKEQIDSIRSIQRTQPPSADAAPEAEWRVEAIKLELLDENTTEKDLRVSMEDLATLAGSYWNLELGAAGVSSRPDCVPERAWEALQEQTARSNLVHARGVRLWFAGFPRGSAKDSIYREVRPTSPIAAERALAALVEERARHVGRRSSTISGSATCTRAAATRSRRGRSRAALARCG